jgi:transketolase
MAKEIENIKTLCADIVEKAKSGHPGAPLGLSQFVYILFTEYLNLNPDDPKWLNRDVFILSNGHACVIQYVMNYLLGFLSMDDLKNFRQLNSNTPGHPEKNSMGIEVSTGPLGQGVASSLGFAISSKILQEFRFTNKVYCIFGDGCYQEGISQETFSLCSKLGLSNITYIYDSNSITIDGSTTISMRENVKKRFESLNFDVMEIEDDADQIRRALNKSSSRTKMIILHTLIGKDSALEGNSKSHGAPLGKENVEKLKNKFNLPLDEFYVSEDLKNAFSNAKNRMKKWVTENEIKEDLINNAKLEAKLNANAITAEYMEKYVSIDQATRNHLKDCINAINTNLMIISGSADLLPCIPAKLEGSASLNENNYTLNSYIHYGIREHSMCGIMNGIAAHGILTPMGGTFLNFATYGMPAIKIACMDNLKLIYIFTHDSIGLGEDGPTHQPIETLATLRVLPNLTTFRPCDGRETRSAVAIAFKHNGPCALILTRQKLPDLDCTLQGNLGYIEKNYSHSDVERGAYFLIKTENPEIIILATGSEVQIAVEIQNKIKDYRISVVSMISFELFELQSKEYQNLIIPKRRSNQKNKPFVVSIEALSSFGWGKYSDIHFGMDVFGRSAPFKDIFEYFGLTADKISKKIVKAFDEFKRED